MLAIVMLCETPTHICWVLLTMSAYLARDTQCRTRVPRPVPINSYVLEAMRSSYHGLEFAMLDFGGSRHGTV